MDDKTGSTGKGIRNIVFKALKATLKAIILYVAYFFLWSFVSPLSELIPGLQQTLEAFVIVYIALMILGELTSGTIYQHFFSAARTLFVIAYLIMSLNGGMFGLAYENVNLMIDLRLFVVVAMILSLVGLAKSVIQAIDFMNQRAEPPLI